MMKYYKGDKVKHPKQEGWGLGIVLEDQRGDNVKIFFENAGEKLLSIKFFMPIKVDGEAVKDAQLENLYVAANQATLSDLIKCFLRVYPKGFDDPLYQERELDQKIVCYELAQEFLGQLQFKTLLELGEYSQVLRPVKDMVKQDTMNLMTRSEKIPLTDALNDLKFSEPFAKSLYDLIYGDDKNFDQYFKTFSNVLVSMDIGYWRVLTYFLFMFNPEKYILVQPSVIQDIAKSCHFNIHYKESLNIKTYRQVLKLSALLKEELITAGLTPDDMMDIQSFMSVVKRYNEQ